MNTPNPILPSGEDLLAPAKPLSTRSALLGGFAIDAWRLGNRPKDNRYVAPPPSTTQLLKPLI